jgi:hypothetical protein
VDLAFYELLDELGPGDGSTTLRPERAAASLWRGGAQIRGSAVSGALAREAERVAAAHGASELLPVRWTLDLFRPAAMADCRVSGRVVRAGRRLCLVDVVMQQVVDGRDIEVARASTLFLARRATTGSAPVWSRDLPTAPPPVDLLPGTTESRLYYSEGTGWTGVPDPHQNAARKQVWLFGIPVVPEETASPFQLTAMAGDVTNIVVSWGAEGVSYINADVGVSLSRLPAGSELGVAAELRVQEEGIAVGVGTLFDREGVFGTSTVSTLWNPGDPVDPRELGGPLPEGS